MHDDGRSRSLWPLWVPIALLRRVGKSSFRKEIIQHQQNPLCRHPPSSFFTAFVAHHPTLPLFHPPSSAFLQPRNHVPPPPNSCPRLIVTFPQLSCKTTCDCLGFSDWSLSLGSVGQLGNWSIGQLACVKLPTSRRFLHIIPQSFPIPPYTTFTALTVVSSSTITSHCLLSF